MRKLVPAAVIFAFLGSAAFAYGPLLPWSPVKPGYAATSFARSVVYASAQQPLLADYHELDEMMREAESFHGLSFRRGVGVIACKNWGDCERALPWLNTRILGGVTLGAGDVIYITPKLQEMGFHTREFLRHELSHALLYQHQSLLSAYQLTQTPWLMEGLAVSFGRQQDYLSRDEFVEQAAHVEVYGYLDPARRAQPWNARLAYPAQRYFVEYLKQRFGEVRFGGYLRAALGSPPATTPLFHAAFGVSLNEAIHQYQQEVRHGHWPPQE